MTVPRREGRLLTLVRVARGAAVSLRPVVSFVETLVASGNGATLSAAHIDILPSPCTPIDSHSVISREVPAIISSARDPVLEEGHKRGFVCAFASRAKRNPRRTGRDDSLVPTKPAERAQVTHVC